MATGGAVLLPSNEKTNFLRLAALIIDGGTLALKTQFDAAFPPQTLGQDLQAHGNFNILLQLKNQRILTQAQFNLLFPPPATFVASSDFDVCLFTCLIQNLPAFHQQNSPVWAQKGPPAPTDLSLAADVKRLRHLRNKVRLNFNSVRSPEHALGLVGFVCRRSPSTLSASFLYRLAEQK